MDGEPGAFVMICFVGAITCRMSSRPERYFFVMRWLFNILFFVAGQVGAKRLEHDIGNKQWHRSCVGNRRKGRLASFSHSLAPTAPLRTGTPPIQNSSSRGSPLSGRAPPLFAIRLADRLSVNSAYAACHCLARRYCPGRLADHREFAG